MGAAAGTRPPMWRPVDVLVAGAFFCWWMLAINVGTEPEARDPDAVAYGMGAVLALLLLVRRRWPRAVLLGSVALSMAYHATGYAATGAEGILLGVPAYTAVVAGHRWFTIAVAVGVIGWAGTWRIAFEQSDPGPVLRDGWTEGAIFAAVILLGEVVRTRRALLEEARLRAAAQEQAKEREIRERVAAERLGIARELHDVLAHTLSVVAVQAGVALDGDDEGGGRQEETRTALQAIRSASRSAMAELRATVAVLRTGAGEPDPGVATRLPAPTLGQLDDLVGVAAQAGLDLDVDIDPAVEDVPPMVGVTAFRIVQESITNVIRHAGARRVTVAVRRWSGELVVEVRDDGRGPQHNTTTRPTQGFGITGMVERAAAIGGTVEAGPAAPHGFRVIARLPVDGEEAPA